jgi:hypothetical protein
VRKLEERGKKEIETYKQTDGCMAVEKGKKV